MPTYEVHIIVDAKFDEQIKGYINTTSFNEKLIRPRYTCAISLYGDFPYQPMLTFSIRSDLDTVKAIVKQVEEHMTENGLPSIRTKIEAQIGFLKEIRMEESYCECHFKVNVDNDSDRYEQVANLVLPFGCHLFYNGAKPGVNPILTLRSYDSLQELSDRYDQVKQLLLENGLQSTGLEVEYSILDTAVYLDKNWLYRDDPMNFITVK